MSPLQLALLYARLMWRSAVLRYWLILETSQAMTLREADNDVRRGVSRATVRLAEVRFRLERELSRA